jgi:ABC-type bacteriocin/lantibiotic exporter with double-glycine peptidase domain
MDCGPASLRCLLQGFGVSVSYGRLREACQTDVDGTSIDMMEEVAKQLGLDAEQIMLPLDHLLLPESEAMPAIVVVSLPNGLTHFVVIWRRHGNFIQVMDPGTGRRWPSCKQFLSEVYIHTTPVPAEAWREWAGGDEFLDGFRRRLANLRVSRGTARRMIKQALSDPGWRPIAALDAATRIVDSIANSGGLSRGRQATQAIKTFYEQAQTENSVDSQIIPNNYWSVRPGPPGEGGEEQILLRGAVLVRARGRRVPEPAAKDQQAEGAAEAPTPLSPELIAALEEPPSRPGMEIFKMLRADGLLAPLFLLVALALSAAGTIVEALLFRGFFDLGRSLGLADQRMGAIGALLLFIIILLLLEFPIATGLLNIGRHLEARLRLAFLEKIPKLGDRYFQSRLISDMAQRSHSVRMLRLMPTMGGSLIRSCLGLAVTTAGIAWLDPASAPLAILVAVLSVFLPLAAQPLIVERDLRVRSHNGAISRFYLDALLGLVAVRAHGAERSVRREHESLLVEWVRASLGLQRAAVVFQAVTSFFGFGFAVWLLFEHLSRNGASGGVLLLVYWALSLPAFGQEIALFAQQYPSFRNTTLRLLEPLGAPDEVNDEESASAQQSLQKVERAIDLSSGSVRGISIALEGVSVKAAGHTILENIDLTIEAGSHIAIVGPSGAGKSSLVGILLGWYRPASGQILVDGEPLDGNRLEWLRRKVAWVDPAIQIWNRSFIDNLYYGSPTDASLPVGQIIEAAELRSVLEKLPEGLQTPLGEGGALVSGGEGQRVRLGRAMLRPGVRLVILDEPFRGLDRERRRELLVRVRKLWRDATIICVTHDVGETMGFERVLVIEGGHIVEDAPPTKLAESPGSRYRALLGAEMTVREGLWASSEWRKIRLEGGRLIEKSVGDEIPNKNRLTKSVDYLGEKDLDRAVANTIRELEKKANEKIECDDIEDDIEIEPFEDTPGVLAKVDRSIEMRADWSVQLIEQTTGETASIPESAPVSSNLNLLKTEMKGEPFGSEMVVQESSISMPVGQGDKDRKDPSGNGKLSTEQPDKQDRGTAEKSAEIAAVEKLAWPVSKLGEAIETLARRSGLSPKQVETPIPPDGLAGAGIEEIGRWIEMAAGWMSIEAEPAEVAYPEAEKLISSSGPALLRMSVNGEPRFLLVLGGGGQSISILGSDLIVRRFKPKTIRAAICHDLEKPLLAGIDQLLKEAGVSRRNQTRARAAILSERLSQTRIGGCWILRLLPGANFMQQIQQAGLGRKLLTLIGAYTIQYALFIVSWWLIGQGALQGRLELGWLLAWALLLLTLVPFQLLATWLQGMLTIGFGGLLKMRLLYGALRLEPEEIRYQGVGQLLGRVIESETVESLALSGGFLGLVSIIELILAVVILTSGAGGWLHTLLLFGWVALTLLLGRKYFKQSRQWTEERLGMTHDLVERMVGHRTRLAQEARERWHDGEDRALNHYLETSKAMDRTIALLVRMPRGWLVISLLALAPGFIAGEASAAGIAIALGGMLFGFKAFTRLTSGLSNLTDAAIAWRQVAPLFHAASRPESIGSPTFALATGSGSGETRSKQIVADAREIIFRYRDRGEPVLRNCNLQIRTGDRLLLEGPSGGGKSTFASLLTGLRFPESGLLLLRGLDRQTLGAGGWRRVVVAAPQFHENHVLTGTFAFNLLMGRSWPPHQNDWKEAETICGELGLGNLLRKMPAGLLQMVGETGWQLSHGEKSRLYIARALLQNADLIVLDESFAALDPETLRLALQCVLKRASALLVIAHP